MKTAVIAPMLSERDVAPGTEGGIDPLGLAAIADRLGSTLVPGVRERQLHPRFLTAIAVSLAICGEEEFGKDTVAKDGVSEPWQVFEWYLVEGLVRTSGSATTERLAIDSSASELTRDDMPTTRGVPGSLKARQAWESKVPLSAKRYLRTPTVFGFHGVYRALARALGIEDQDTRRLGTAGFELLKVWSKEQGLAGFFGTADGKGRTRRNELHKAVARGLQDGQTWGGWSGWQFFRDHLDLYSAGSDEAGFIINCLLSHQGDGNGFRHEVLKFLTSPKGQKIFEDQNSEGAFHAALRSRASDGLRQLLDAIDSYEAFARLCQNAFDDCLVEMTRANGKVTSRHLGNLQSVKLAAAQVPAMFQELLNRLEPFGESARLRYSCGSLAEHCSETEWARRLLQHHRGTQQRKQPVSKQPWIVELDGGHWQIRSHYQRRYQLNGDATTDEPDRNRYVHGYRTNSLWNFARDLKVLR